MTCIGTDFVIALARKEQAAIEKLKEVEDEGEIVCITAMSVADMYMAAHDSKNKNAAKDVKNLLGMFAVLNFGCEAAKLLAEIQSAKSSTDERDLMIASIAIANKQVLISRNSQLENVHGLQVESW